MFFVAWVVLIHNLPLPEGTWWWHWLLLLGCNSLFLLAFGCYDSLWRYASPKEYLLQFLALTCGNVLFALGNRFLIAPELKCPLRLQLFAMLLTLVTMWMFRFVCRYQRQLRLSWQHSKRATTKIAIIGAGDVGVAMVDEIRRDTACTYDVVCFFDDDPIKQRAHVRGIPVRGPVSTVVEHVRNTEIKELVVAIPSLENERKQEILKICSQTGCRVRMMPNIDQQLSGEGGSLLGHMRDVQPNDLLGREMVNFQNTDVYEFLSGKVVMVTGGGGSIGSELCRQIAAQHPLRLVIVDIYENNAYDIQQELRHQYGDGLDLRVEIASVRDEKKIDILFRRYHPQIVFHAAAHKHVPLMEPCPEEAIKNNVFGTYNVAHAAARYQAEKFVLISTDKAVNPTNVMGASKRLCEMVVQSMQNVSDTVFVAVRFGNVLGSNGSVIPLFKRQLAGGGPLTITDRRIIRYFMTIPEAAQLVMQAGAMAKSAQVFVLDMGEPVKILDLAENLVRMAGLTPYVDVDIIETGLRPGEKLYEELLMDSDTLTATKNNKIFIEQQEAIPHEEMEADLELLRQVIETEDVEQMVATMRRIVPTFKTPEEVNRQAVAQHRVPDAESPVTVG
ncbi:MAG: polysaccharide biosynthesis protein [Clostridia bacterium]|nr:polysaccharide biosynthesis protein [Clostridia bacterium]